MFKKIIFGLSLWLFATTSSFGANFQDGVNAIEKGDYKTAFTIFEDLALKGDSKAQYNLGLMYENGYGVKQDYKKAIEWYEKAANPEKFFTLDFEAQFNLGTMYVNGKVVKQNKKLAKELYGKACDGGIELGCMLYKSLNDQGY